MFLIISSLTESLIGIFYEYAKFLHVGKLDSMQRWPYNSLVSEGLFAAILFLKLQDP